MTETKADIIVCKFCGEDIKATALKCKHCGEYLKDDIENKKSSVQPMINIVNSNENNVNVGDDSVRKNWIVALLLAIFLGWAGIDRFYLGHGGLGVIKLFTLGLFGIMRIIDIFLILFKCVGGVKWK